MLDKYTCPLNGYTPPELSFSFMVTSKVRKITFFVSLENIILLIWRVQCFIYAVLNDTCTVYWDAIVNGIIITSYLKIKISSAGSFPNVPVS